MLPSSFGEDAKSWVILPRDPHTLLFEQSWEIGNLRQYSILQSECLGQPGAHRVSHLALGIPHLPNRGKGSAKSVPRFTSPTSTLPLVLTTLLSLFRFHSPLLLTCTRAKGGACTEGRVATSGGFRNRANFRVKNPTWSSRNSWQFRRQISGNLLKRLEMPQTLSSSKIHLQPLTMTTC